MQELGLLSAVNCSGQYVLHQRRVRKASLAVRKLCQQGFLKVDEPVRAEAEHVARLRLQQTPQPAGPAVRKGLGQGSAVGSIQG